MSDLDETIRQANEAVARMKKAARTWAGPCRDCRWQDPDLLFVDEFSRCRHPAEIARSFSSAIGTNVETVFCTTARRSGEPCGPDGLFFERGLSPVKFWSIIILCAVIGVPLAFLLGFWITS